ncbi:MAG: N-acetylneuraminate synthase, partial [Xanthomonadales bacterium]|nr:N-acetylneuraminate synthase [Xanthomonadales bacterium]
MKTLIIAEAGVNHNGDPVLARQLVEAAAAAGADLVKFQTFSADRLVSAKAPKAEYQARTTGTGESQHAMLRRLELDRGMHQGLIRHCEKNGIAFFSTGFDIESVDMLLELGLDRLKIPSGEITNLPYLRHVGRQGRPVILSTGMAYLSEIQAAIDALEQSGTPRERITVLHCNTEYPTPMADVNLRAMLTIRD